MPRPPVFQLVVVLWFALLAANSNAALVGNLEAPKGFASQVGNVQGWVYTTTPGAELIQPFDVRVNGEKIMEVPCCSARGDVQGDDPDIPLQSGFSGVTNWAREAGGDPITVEVVVRDTAGGELILSNTDIDVFALSPFPFSQVVEWDELEGGVGGPAPVITSRCALSNIDGAAALACTNLVSRRADESHLCAGEVRFLWDRASQGFKQTSSCEELPRWTDNGDGTATDNTTGLDWELKTTDGSIHDVSRGFRWCENSGLNCSDPSNPPDGSLFYDFLGELNAAVNQGTTGCFAGHCDWRMPTAKELATLVDSTTSCGICPMCSSIPGPAADDFYWTRSSGFASDAVAWVVDFCTGTSTAFDKSTARFARAVRGGW